MVPYLIVTVGIFFIISYLCTGCSLAYAKKRQIIDIPNARSSHTTPTPRGGGIGIVFAFCSGLCLLWYLPGGINDYLLAAACGAVIAAIGWIDDNSHVSAAVRITIHLTISCITVVGLTAIHHHTAFLFTSLQILRSGLGLFEIIGLTALINFYNFMDGIDGLAGSEGVFVAAGLAVLMRLAGAANLQWMCWILAACCLGFLCWNMPHARIFMGDVGSGFLGYVFGAILLMSSTRTIHLITVGSILLAVFITDTLVTLMRRVIRRTRWYEAHCEHAFQHAALKYGSHFKVTMGITAINLLWLFPIAFISCMRPGSAPLMLIAAYIPLIGLVFYFHAGTAGSQKGAACVNNEFKASEEVGDQP